MLNLSLSAILLLVSLVSGNNDVTTATATATNTTSQYWTVFVPTNTPTYDLVASIPFTYEGGGFWSIAGIFCGAQDAGSTITTAVGEYVMVSYSSRRSEKTLKADPVKHKRETVPHRTRQRPLELG